MGQAGIFGSAAFLWPAILTAEAGRITAALAHDLADLAVPAGAARKPWRWATPNRITLDLGTMRLRDFSTGSTGVPTLICAPYSLHGSNIADFARGHSLVRTFQAGGVRRLFVTDWRSATAEMRFLSIDSLLADLNVAVDDLGGTVDLVGICQGGWMGLLYAARFPRKVRKLVIAGAPIDIAAGTSAISAAAGLVAMPIFEDFVATEGGLVIGQKVLDLWKGPDLTEAEIKAILQEAATDKGRLAQAHEARFRDWYATTVDLPGTYYLQVVEWLFKENQLAEGRFTALGHLIDLAKVTHPTFLLAAGGDELVAPGQLFGAAKRLGTKPALIRQATAEGSHMALFVGTRTLTEVWPRIIRWLKGDTGNTRRPSMIGVEAARGLPVDAGHSGRPRRAAS
jgi:poly(3-hydroxyalkanoate) synthetase